MATKDEIHLAFGKVAQKAQLLEAYVISLILLEELHESVNSNTLTRADAQAVVPSLTQSLYRLEADRHLCARILFRRRAGILSVRGGLRSTTVAMLPGST